VTFSRAANLGEQVPARRLSDAELYQSARAGIEFHRLIS
jgi:hypothetical protein